jgi:hypothetical protein
MHRIGNLAALATLDPASGTTTIPGTASTYANLFYPTAPPARATARSKVTAHPCATAGAKITAPRRTGAGTETTPSALS